MRNLELKSQIVRHFGSQVACAHELGVSEPRLSRIIAGYDIPNAHEEELFAQRLGYKFKKPTRAKDDIAENLQPEN
jgi:hypothetical protein